MEAKLGSCICKTDEFFSELLIVHLFAFSIKVIQVKLSKPLEKEKVITFTKDHIIYLISREIVPY